MYHASLPSGKRCPICGWITVCARSAGCWCFPRHTGPKPNGCGPHTTRTRAHAGRPAHVGAAATISILTVQGHVGAVAAGRPWAGVAAGGQGVAADWGGLAAAVRVVVILVSVVYAGAYVHSKASLWFFFDLNIKINKNQFFFHSYKIILNWKQTWNIQKTLF